MRASQREGRFGKINAVHMLAVSILAPLHRNCLIPWFKLWWGMGAWSKHWTRSSESRVRFAMLQRAFEIQGKRRTHARPAGDVLIRRARLPLRTALRISTTR